MFNKWYLLLPLLHMPNTTLHKRQVHYPYPPVAHNLIEKCMTFFMVIESWSEIFQIKKFRYSTFHRISLKTYKLPEIGLVLEFKLFLRNAGLLEND